MSLGFAVGGGAESLGDPSDQGTCGGHPRSGVAVENHWSETDAVMVGCIVGSQSS